MYNGRLVSFSDSHEVKCRYMYVYYTVYRTIIVRHVGLGTGLMDTTMHEYDLVLDYKSEDAEEDI